MIVHWSELALGHVQAIRDTVARSSPRYAQALANRIVRKTEILGDFPLLGAEVPEYGDQTIREVLEYPYRILYQVTAERVEVLGVIHGARRLPRTPPG